MFVYLSNKIDKMLNYEVANFNLNAINHSINSDFISFFHDFEAFSKRDFTLTEAKIDLDRKTLYHWKKIGLLPFTGSPKKEEGKKTWGRFSFIELCWLRMLIDLREVGIGLEKLQKIKQQFFPENFIDTLFSKPINDIDSVDPDIQKDVEGLLENGILKITPEIRALFNQLQFSLFSCTLYSLMLTRGNYVFIGMGNDRYDLINLNEMLANPTIGILDIHKILSNESVFFINMKKIVADLSSTHNHFANDTRLGRSISMDAVDKIKEIFMIGNVSEVTIKVNDNGTKTAHVKRKMKIEDLEKEVRHLMKKGNYCDVVIKTRDGNVQYFEHTEIVKL